MAETNDAQLKEVKIRLPYIDVLKGIGIILVIWGHMIPRGTLWNIIYGCHMPLFIFCSGLFEKKQLRWPRLLKLGVKYLGLSVLGMGIYYLLQEFGNLYYIKQSIYNVMIGGISPGHGIYPVEALWFIPCLLMTILIYHVVCLIPVPIWRNICVVVLAIMGAVLTQYRNEIPMVFNVDVSMVLFPFFYFGGILKEKLPVVTNIRSAKLLVGAIAMAVLYYLCTHWNGEVNIYRGLFGKELIVFYMGALLGTALLLIVSVLISRYVEIISQVLQQLGKHTLVMMGIHQIVILLLREKIGMWWILLPAVILISYGVSVGLRTLQGFMVNRRKKSNDRKVSI